MIWVIIISTRNLAFTLDLLWVSIFLILGEVFKSHFTQMKTNLDPKPVKNWQYPLTYGLVFPQVATPQKLPLLDNLVKLPPLLLLEGFHYCLDIHRIGLENNFLCLKGFYSRGISPLSLVLTSIEKWFFFLSSEQRIFVWCESELESLATERSFCSRQITAGMFRVFFTYK